eukprot:snap_masked-scaffold_45-processed-gene-0.60-mRNA-1 protein AED:1.00 eAED:1.00 QI:0/-1/0/0/-1/1/1/0/78
MITTGTKENISKQLENVIRKIEKRYNKNVKCLFSDNGSELMKIHKLAEYKGIRLEISSNYMPCEMSKLKCIITKCSTA